MDFLHTSVKTTLPESNEVSPAVLPLVTVALATYNEEDFVARCLRSLLAQRTKVFALEILVIDGGSTDRTCEEVLKVAAADSRIKLLRNPDREAAFAWNIGIEQGTGTYFCTFGAHSVYAPDYIETCLNAMLRDGATACGGRVITKPGRQTLTARLIAWVLGHSFGSSGNSFRTHGPGPIDSPAFPVIDRKALQEIGGFNTALVRNEDNDICRRLREADHLLICTWDTQFEYYPRASLKGILHYAFRNGYWVPIGARHHPKTMRLRHFVPFIFTLCLLVSTLAAGLALALHAPKLWLLPLLAVAGSHLLVGSVAALQVAARERSAAPLLLPPLFMAFHGSYGMGTLAALLTNARPARNAAKTANVASVPPLA